MHQKKTHFHSLWRVLREHVHRVPADVRVDKNKLADVTEDPGRARIQLHPPQRVRAQVEEVQVRDVGHDGADLTNTKASGY